MTAMMILRVWPQPSSAGPSKGTVALHVDGSFVYTPTRGLTGADSFTYMINDGVWNSEVATVDLTISAIATYTLSIDTAGDGRGIVTMDPAGGIYADLTIVTLTALPDDGRFFEHWSGDITNADATTTILMDGDKAVTANFGTVPPITYALTVKVAGNGSVTLQGSTFVEGGNRKTKRNGRCWLAVRRLER